MGFVLRRSLPSIVGLIGLLLGVGTAAVVLADLPLWFPAAFAIGLLGIQYAVNPAFIQWLVPADVVANDGSRYLTDDPIGQLVARRCRDAGVPLVTLGIVDDGTPNAFTFGHTPGDARMWLTRGLIERLDEDELDAVICHELGHVRNWDFVVMTVAAAVPLVLYWIYVAARGSRRDGATIAVTAYVGYLVSQFVLLALSRARELGADHWSCACTGNGDALASALVKVAYGMGRARAEHQDRMEALAAGGRGGKKEAAKLQSKYQRAHSLHALGIFDARHAPAVEAALARGIDPERAVSAMRWEQVNPWGATLEKLSSHPLVVRRIEALERSGLPGAPRNWGVMHQAASVGAEERNRLRARWAGELALAVAPWMLLGGLSLLGLFTGSLISVGLALIAAGMLLVVKQVVRYPSRFVEVDEVTGLLERVDASPVRGIPVIVRGRIIGRGMPGYVLSPDLVVSDDSGFVPLLYRQPIPFARMWFGLAKVPALLGRDIVARGWYRRSPGPVIELRSASGIDGGMVNCWEWVARFAGSGLVLVLGLLVLAVGAAGGW